VVIGAVRVAKRWSNKRNLAEDPALVQRARVRADGIDELARERRGSLDAGEERKSSEKSGEVHGVEIGWDGTGLVECGCAMRMQSFSEAALFICLAEISNHEISGGSIFRAANSQEQLL
jgi:hypothetical protein